MIIWLMLVPHRHCLFCFLLASLLLAQFLACGRHRINGCWLNKERMRWTCCQSKADSLIEPSIFVHIHTQRWDWWLSGAYLIPIFNSDQGTEIYGYICRNIEKIHVEQSKRLNNYNSKIKIWDCGHSSMELFDQKKPSLLKPSQ